MMLQYFEWLIDIKLVGLVMASTRLALCVTQLTTLHWLVQEHKD